MQITLSWEEFNPDTNTWEPHSATSTGYVDAWEITHEMHCSPWNYRNIKVSEPISGMSTDIDPAEYRGADYGND